mgnify:FL=1
MNHYPELLEKLAPKYAKIKKAMKEDEEEEEVELEAEDLEWIIDLFKLLNLMF